MTAATYLATGEFGEAASVIDGAAGSLERFGVPRLLSRGVAVHPMLDRHVVLRATSDEGPLAESSPEFEPVSGNHRTVDRWFYRDHPLDERLRDLVQKLLDDNPQAAAVISDPSEVFERRIREAAAVMDEEIPDLWASTLPFVCRMFEANDPNLAGATWDDVAGVVVLGSVQCSDTQSTIEALLHEAAHSKSYRLFRRFQHMHDPHDEEFIDIPWWRTESSSRVWDVDRALVACHVYTHIAAFYESCLANSPDRFPDAWSRLQRTAFRAQYLGNLLLQLDGQLMDTDRQSFVRWVVAAIPEIPGLNEAGERALQTSIRSFEGAEEALARRTSVETVS